MPSFPTLKTGAVAQYPLDCTFRTQTQSVRFLDGTTQQYRLMKPLRRWKLALSKVDEQDLDAVIDFVEQQEGLPFSFVDPVSGDTVAKCVISQAGLEATMTDELTNEAILTIEETL